MVKRKKLFFCLSLILSTMMFSSSLLIRIQGEQNISNNVYQVVQSDKSTWFWPSVEVLSQTSDDSHGQAIKIDDNNNIHFVFNDDTSDLDGSGSDRDVFYMRWDSETKIWSDPETVSTESSGNSDNPAIAIDKNNNIHVAWVDFTDILGAGSDRDVFYKRRTPAGVWTTSELVSTDSTANLQQVSIDVDNSGNPSIAWTDQTDVGDLGGSDYDIFYNSLTVLTSTWLGMTLVSTESDTGSYNPDVIIADNDDIHFAWYDYSDLGSGADQDIFYKKYMVAEADWLPLIFISSESTDDSRHPSMTIDNVGKIHIVWEDITDYEESSVDKDIFYKYYDPQLSSWSTTEVITIESTTVSTYATVAVDKKGIVHVTWEDLTPFPGTGSDYDIYYKFKNSPSDDWSSLTLVSNEMTLNSFVPIIAVDGLGHVHIVWYDETDYDGCGFDYDIFYRKFVGPPEDITLYPISPNPSIVGNITIDWEESFGALNYDIYRDLSYISTTDSLTPIASVSTNTFEDELNASGTYYYSVIASNDYADSDLSNVESVVVHDPADQQGFFEDFNWGEVIIIVGIVGALQIILTLTMVVILKTPPSKGKKK
ncbi:MAG: hypothetical protein HGN29_08805 [Asgard group archaeon]|nr:hypothetical protein [Asgard group archaeon]